MGEIVGAIAVVATIGYLAVQVRSSVRASKASVRQAVSDSIIDLQKVLVESRDFHLSVMRVEGGEGDYADHMRIGFMANNWWRTYENIYYQYRNGFLDEEEWLAHRDMIRTVFKSDRAVQKAICNFYLQNEIALSSPFRSMVDSFLERVFPDGAHVPPDTGLQPTTDS
jgi:hypothetical protein